MQARTEVVSRLVAGANEGMLEVAEGSTASEVISAHFTLLNASIQVVLEGSKSPKDREFNREAILSTLMGLFMTAQGETQ